MNSIIICEGSTDSILLQYFLRKAYGWEDTKERIPLSNKFKTFRKLKKEEKTLCIGGSGGVSQIKDKFDNILELNSFAANGEEYDKIIILTDRDEVDTEADFCTEISRILTERTVYTDQTIKNDEWVHCRMKNGQGKEISVDLLLLVIPFEQTGAMETFLLDAIAKADDYDDDIIKQGNAFVDSVDPDKRYLSKRRYITKAKFDVYFSVRTAAEQFVERQNLLKSVPWEKYLLIQDSFRKFADLLLMLSWVVMISSCHAVMRLPGYLSWNVPFDGAAVRPITEEISSYIHALPAL